MKQTTYVHGVVNWFIYCDVLYFYYRDILMMLELICFQIV